MGDQQVTSHQQVMLFTQMLENIKSCLWLVSVTENPECRRALKAESRVCRVQYLRAFLYAETLMASVRLSALWPTHPWLCLDPCILNSAVLLAHHFNLLLPSKPPQQSSSATPWGYHITQRQLGLGAFCSLSKQLTYLKVFSDSQSNSSEHPIDWQIYGVVFKF